MYQTFLSTYESKQWRESMMSFCNNLCLQLALNKVGVLPCGPTTKDHRRAASPYSSKDSAYED